MSTALAVLMSEQEAQECIEKIKKELSAAEFHFEQGQKHFTRSRELIWNLHEYQGWYALGFTNWRECVKSHFEQHGQSILYKQLAAAAVERQIVPTLPIGTIPERVLRPLAKRKFTEQTRQALWEIASSVAGSPASVTTGLMEQVVQTLSDALVTGTLQNTEGEQSAIFEKVREDVLARTVESRKRHQEYLQKGAGIKIISAKGAISHVKRGRSVYLEVTSSLTPDEFKMLTSGKLHLKVSVWGDED